MLFALAFSSCLVINFYLLCITSLTMGREIASSNRGGLIKVRYLGYNELETQFIMHFAPSVPPSLRLEMVVSAP